MIKLFLDFIFIFFLPQTTESSEQQSSSDAGKRKWIEDDSFSEASEHIAPKKRSFSKYHCGKVESSRNGKVSIVVKLWIEKLDWNLTNSYFILVSIGKGHFRVTDFSFPKKH